jgi:hypothetical protein
MAAVNASQSGGMLSTSLKTGITTDTDTSEISDGFSFPPARGGFCDAEFGEEIMAGGPHAGTKFIDSTLGKMAARKK